MTNREKLNSMPLEELGRYLCESMETIGDKTKDAWCCDICPVGHLCKMGKNGFITWLENESRD